MDIFQFIGDFLHLITILMLLLKIDANKNVIGNCAEIKAFLTERMNFSWYLQSLGTSTCASVGSASIQ